VSDEAATADRGAPEDDAALDRVGVLVTDFSIELAERLLVEDEVAGQVGHERDRYKGLTAMPVEIVNDAGDWNRWMLHIKAGAADIVPTNVHGQVTLTWRQLADWYAGGYRSTTSARMAGVRAVSEKVLATLVHSTSQFEPWMPDHF
jgi:hypothetical protein